VTTILKPQMWDQASARAPLLRNAPPGGESRGESRAAGLSCLMRVMARNERVPVPPNWDDAGWGIRPRRCAEHKA